MTRTVPSWVSMVPTRHGMTGERSSLAASPSRRQRQRTSWVGPVIVPDGAVIQARSSEKHPPPQEIRSRKHPMPRVVAVLTPPCGGCAGPRGGIVEDSEIAFNDTEGCLSGVSRSLTATHMFPGSHRVGTHIRQRWIEE